MSDRRRRRGKSNERDRALRLAARIGYLRARPRTLKVLQAVGRDAARDTQCERY